MNKIEKTICSLCAFCFAHIALANDVAESANVDSAVGGELETSVLPQINIDVSAEDLSDSKNNLQTVSTEKLLSTPGSSGDPLRAIQTRPGFTQVTDFGGLPVIRGADPNDASYEVDFLTVDFITHIDGTSIFNEHLIDSFDVLHGVYSYGYFDASSAVIDAKFKTPAESGNNIVVDASLLRAGALAEYKFGDSFYSYFSIRKSVLDLIADSVISDEDNDYNVFPQYRDYHGKFVYDSPKAPGRIAFQVIGAKDRAVEKYGDEFSVRYDSQGIVLDCPGCEVNNKHAVAHQELEFQTLTNTEEITVNEERWYYKTEQHKVLNEEHELRFGGRYQHSTLDYLLDFKTQGCTSLDGDVCEDQKEEVLINFDGTFNVNHYDMFVEHDWYFHESADLTLGLHADYDSYLKEPLLEPRAKLTYYPTESIGFYTGLGLYHRFPKNEELATIVPTYGNPDLKQSKSQHLVFGLNHDLNNRWGWKADMYYKRLTDLVISDDQFNYSNGADGYAYGLELLLDRKQFDKFSGWTSVSLSKTRRRFLETGEEVNYRYDFPVVFNVVGSYQLTDNTSMGLKYRYQSGVPYTPVLGTFTVEDEGTTFILPIRGDRYSERLDSYQRLDFRVDKAFQFTDLDLYFEVINLLNRQNPRDIEYIRNYSDTDITYQLPRIFNLGFKFTY